MNSTSAFLTSLSAIILLITSCRTAEPGSIEQAGNGNMEQFDPYLTEDHQGNAVLCWTAKDPKDSVKRLMYAVYDAETEVFKNTVVVETSAGAKSSTESMNKIAFKSDGTILAVFAKRFENEKSPYAGAIYYSMSADNGRNWSAPRYIHSDTSHHYGRGYFDVSTLRNGEIGAIWLDGRHGEAEKGSALFFASTQKNGGFTRDTCVSKNTCECCRTDLLTDDKGNIHLAYRSISYPENLLGKQVRDLMYSFSEDNGETFRPQQAISNDNWAIDGCPHTGPSLAANKSGVHATWFTAGGNSGLYYSSALPSAGQFNTRNLITATGRHPQMIPLADGRMALVCEEGAGDGGHASHQSKNNGMTHTSPSGAKIMIRILNNGQLEKTIAVTDGKYADHHAVMTPLKDGLLVAWVREDNGMRSVYFSRIKSL